MEFITTTLLILLGLVPVIRIFGTGDWQKKWRKIKFEARMSWIGLSGSITDCFYRGVDKVELFPQPHKVAVVTGGGKGIGLAVLQKLLECEMTVVVGVRDPVMCKEIVEETFKTLNLKGRVFYEKCDVGDMTSVREFASTIKKMFQAVNLLVNNAGILSVPYVLSKDGFVSQMAVNYLGHFLLTHLLMPELKSGSTAGDKSRVVNVASCVHQIGKIRYDDFNCRNYYRAGMAYADSKLAQVMFTKHFQRLMDESNCEVLSHAAHPGVVYTAIFRKSFFDLFGNYSITRSVFKTPEQGSRTVLYAAISPDLEQQGGLYLENCQIVKTFPTANDPLECQKLFEFTCDLLKIKSFGEKEEEVSDDLRV